MLGNFVGFLAGWVLGTATATALSFPLWGLLALFTPIDLNEAFQIAFYIMAVLIFFKLLWAPRKDVA